MKSNKHYTSVRKFISHNILTILFILHYLCTLGLTSVIVDLQREIESMEEEIISLKEEIKPEVLVVEESAKIELAYEEAVLPRLYTDEDVTVLTKMLWGEARGVSELTTSNGCVSSKCQQAAVIWTVLNRYDAGYSDSITEIVTAPHQYSGYKESNPVDEELKDLVLDVLDRWNHEKNGKTDVGRVLPADYLWFRGDGTYNHFRNEYKSRSRWTWELADPYI